MSTAATDPSANVATVSAPLPSDRDEEIVSESSSESIAAESGADAVSSSDADLLRRYDILRLRASNPSPFTLSGTNTWVVGRDPAWIVDPGPLIEAHLESLYAAIESRGGLGGVVLTHDHEDHAEAVGELLARHPAPLAGGRGKVDVVLEEGVHVGPFDPVATSGHSPDSYALIADGACFSGDAVLGQGSVYIAPHPGAMANYMLALTRLRMREDFSVICPGHGPIVWDVHGKLEEYVQHRLDRERALLYALTRGLRSERELLDAAWPEIPESMRPLASVTLAAHLDKLEDDHVLPGDVQRPTFEGLQW
jgi:glyoxylase-like metal-dependent hydrolase (beta-lactamase superfamily II)